jgi:hypothetical protein
VIHDSRYDPATAFFPDLIRWDDLFLDAPGKLSRDLRRSLRDARNLGAAKAEKQDAEADHGNACQSMENPIGAEVWVRPVKMYLRLSLRTLPTFHHKHRLLRRRAA